MTITNSITLVLFLTVIWVLFPFIKTIIQGRKITAEDITYYIVHVMLFYPVPGLLLNKRQLTPFGMQSSEDMARQIEAGLTSEVVSINYGIILYLFLLNLILLYLRGNIFSRYLILRNKWFYLVMLLNVGIIGLSISINDLFYLFLFSVFLLFGKFERSHIIYIVKSILLLFIYPSFFLILLKPEASIYFGDVWIGIFNNPNGTVLVVNFTLTLILLSSFFNLKRVKWHYLHLFALFLLIFMSGSRNGLLVFLSIAGLYFAYNYKLKFIGVYIIFLSIPALFAILFYLNNINLVSLTSNRILIWNYVFEEFSSNKFSGLGSDFFDWENRKNNFPNHLLFANSSFNAFIDYIVLYGIAGTIIIIGFTISLLKKTKRINNIFLMFFLLFLIPNLFESYFKPPALNINNIIFLVSLFIINGSKNFSGSWDKSGDKAKKE